MATERVLLERAKAYDEDALGEIYDKYAPLIYSYLYRRVSDAKVAEDLTSEVFVRVLEAIQSEQFWHTSFRGWLYRIAHNLVVDHYRTRPPRPLVPLDELQVAGQGDPGSALTKKLSRERLLGAVRRLTALQQEVLALRFGERLTAREVGEVMDKSISAVEALQHRGLAALRRILLEED